MSPLPQVCVEAYLGSDSLLITISSEPNLASQPGLGVICAPKPQWRISKWYHCCVANRSKFS